MYAAMDVKIPTHDSTLTLLCTCTHTSYTYSPPPAMWEWKNRWDGLLSATTEKLAHCSETHGLRLWWWCDRTCEHRVHIFLVMRGMWLLCRPPCLQWHTLIRRTRHKDSMFDPLCFLSVHVRHVCMGCDENTCEHLKHHFAEKDVARGVIIWFTTRV